MKSVSVLLATAAVLATTAASSFSNDPLAPRPNGMAIDRPSKHILMGATIHLSPTKTYDAENNPAVLIEDGKIVGVIESANQIRLKPGYQVHELSEDHHIYAGFIDPFVEIETQAVDANSAGKHHNRFVTPQRDALVGPGLPDKHAKSLRELGFTTAMIAPDTGIFRGWTATVSTADAFNDPSLGEPPIYQDQAGQMMGFDRTNWADADYPTSHMGVIAIMRQTFLDAEHYHKSKANNPSCLSEIQPNDTTLFYDTSHELEAALADKVSREFNHKNIVIVGAGTEHRRLQALKDMNYPVVVPMTFPKDPEVWTINDADNISLAALQHWERAPANARWLHNSGLTVALTTSKLRDDEKFFKNLHTAIKKGLPASDALAMLTTNAAEILDLDDQGEIKVGNIANLVVTSADMFDPESDAKVLQTWIDGRKHHINDAENNRFEGTWSMLPVGSHIGAPFTIEGNTLTLHDDDTDHKARKVEINDDAISFIMDVEDDGSYIFSGTLMNDGTIRGTGLGSDQSTYNWTASPTDAQISMNTFKGTWNATLDERFELTFKVSSDSVTVIEHVEDGDDITQEADEASAETGTLNFTFDHTPFGMAGTFSIALTPPSDDDTLIGLGTRPDGKAFNLTATKAEDDSKADHHSTKLADLPETPFGPYANSENPPQDSVLIHSATIWTQTDDGIIDNGWIMIRNGKVHSIGQGGYPRMAVDHTIDGTGMHITPGLIDAHSHTGLFRFGVNESGQAVTAEVRIEDSLDPGYIGFYRELAGGLTASQLLHGSANPIGGQSKTIKLRWGMNRPEDMYMEDAMPGIKFALGENVKQSNWGDDKTTRYPQTRLGVETTMRDRFTKAREYADRMSQANNAKKNLLAFFGAPSEYMTTEEIVKLIRDEGYDVDGFRTDPDGSGRRKFDISADGIQKMIDELLPTHDLELQILAEILAGERLVHCHSYRQDEILMLCRIAEEFDFKIGTFQHGLETYKVAEIVKEHSIGASIFSDWWAYKVEVTDAIPYAGPINHEVGLLTSFNSDSDDVARRMNVEAAKALKYARASGIAMTEQEALAFVTNNPAIQLGVDDRIGSLSKGMDADIAVWNGSPLSSLSRCEMTFVDGRRYFSIEDDLAHRATIDAERNRLIQLALSDGKPKSKKSAEHDHDETDHAGHGHNHDHINDHFDNFANDTRGDCGCNQLLPAWNTDY